jgi:hypothetical protein
MRKNQSEQVTDNFLLIVPFGILYMQLVNLLVILWNG